MCGVESSLWCWDWQQWRLKKGSSLLSCVEMQFFIILYVHGLQPCYPLRNGLAWFDTPLFEFGEIAWCWDLVASYKPAFKSRCRAIFSVLRFAYTNYMFEQTSRMDRKFLLRIIFYKNTSKFCWFPWPITTHICKQASKASEPRQLARTFICLNLQ